MVSPVRKMIFHVIILFNAIVIGLIIAEFFVRLLHLEDRAQEVHFGRNSKGQIVGADPVGEGCRFKISTNRELVYEPSKPPVLPPAKSPHELRILCLGDSIIDNFW
ncbi:MAG: hypothetical protein RAO92_10525 [Candidatus Euphemobacter frigidus]|nr:hypothetical protein [Candidatus Euphemobacter frigidus]MDP8276819.1 hypothetical protein [Candidatus Euphemobacter frigidus]